MIQLDAPDPALDSGRRLRGRGRGRIHDYLEAAGHGDDEQGPLFRPIRNNRPGRIDKALVAEGRHRGAVRHVEKTRGLPPPEPARPGAARAGADRTHAVHARLARKPGIAPTLPCRAQQERAASFPRAGHLHLQTRPANKAGKQGRIADRSAEAQQFRASGLNLVIAAIVFWNSTYIADAIAHLRATEQSVPDAWLAHTSPLSWEHISFSGDFLRERAAATADKRRPLNLGQTRVAA